MYRLISLLSLLVVATSLPNPENVKASDVETAARAAKDCDGGIFSVKCLKIEAISALEKLNAKEEVSLFSGVSLVKEPAKENGSKAEEFAAELARSLPSKPEERLDKYLLYRLGTYLDTHSVKLKLFDEGASEEARAMFEGRKGGMLGGGGKKGGMGGLMAMAMMMKGSMMAMAMGGLAMLAGKALMTALMSLLLSAIVGLKSMSGGGKSTTYEIVAKPIYSHSHSHSTGHEDVGAYGGGHGWSGRNLNVKRR